jgi:hypothetical protein|tara:strand:+ start:500 stop:745 length:246 start_codon:yes stop_codon:yes gene_type:complete
MDLWWRDKTIEEIGEKRPDLDYINPDEIDVHFEERMGEGGFCTAYRCTWNGAFTSPMPTPRCAFPSRGFFPPPGATVADPH